MLKLNQLYFRNFLIIFFSALLLTTFLGYFMLKSIETTNHEMMLKNLIKEFVVLEKNSFDKQKLIKEIKKQTNTRVTIIDKDGKVLYESDRDVKGMENHLLRPEIKEASLEGFGSSVRFSKSVKKDFLYVAKLQGARFIRMAYPLESIKDKFLKFWLQTVLLFGIVLVLALFSAFKINSKISEDMKLIKTSLKNLLQSRYDVLTDDVKCCREFAVIYDRIVKVAKKLRRRDEQKKKFTRRLKELNKKQGDIISAISHEFKNPVAAIMGYAQTVQDDEDISPAMRKRFIKKVINNSQKISIMIDRLSLAVKIEGENITLQKTTFKLLPLVKEVKETVLQKYKDREVVLEVEDVTITADKTLIENVLTNLVENALKYSEDEVIIKINQKRVEVRDQGIGIEEENLQKITDRFFRVDTLTWDNSIGVGLYIVKYILKLHNTTLNIESKPQVGSKFWFSIKGMK